MIAQVDKIVQKGSIPAKEVFLHGFMVDYVVEGKPKYSRQSFATDAFRPEIAGLAKVPSTGFEPLVMGPRKICCRRAAMELRPGSLINPGHRDAGRDRLRSPGGGAFRSLYPLHGVWALRRDPLGGIDFGAAIDPEAMYRMADILQLYDGGALDMAVLGFAEVDRWGNVNAHSFNNRVVGAGGFIDITQNVKSSASLGPLPPGNRRSRSRATAWPSMPKVLRKNSWNKWKRSPSPGGKP